MTTPAEALTVDQHVLNDAGALVRTDQVLPAARLDHVGQPPGGPFMQVQIKGYQEYEGYLTEADWCGEPYGFLHDRDGRLVAMFPPSSVHCIVPRFDFGARPAIEGSESRDDDDDDESPGDGEPPF